MDRRVFDPIINPLPLADGVAIQVNWPRVAFALVPAALMLLALGFKAGQGISPPAATEVPSAAAIEGEPTLQLVAEPASQGPDSRSLMVPLGIFVRGPSELASAAAIEVVGLPSGWALSAGRPLGDRWRIPAAQLSAAAILPPRGFSGAVDLQMELRLADDTLVEVRSVRRAMTDPALATENTPNTNLLLSSAEGLLVLGDISTARQVLQKAAEAGNADAALLLGETYEACSPSPLQCGADADRAAATWYKMAANLGSAEARQRLDRLASKESGGPTLATEEHPESHLLISRAQSLLVQHDIWAARLLLQKAAEAGNADAALLLGETYERCSHYVGSLRCAEDRATARTWYEMAAKLGSAEARERLDRLAGSVQSPPLSRRSFATHFDLSIERDLIVH